MIPEVIFVDQERFDNMIKVIDESYDLIQEYDSKPRQFGKVMLYPVAVSYTHLTLPTILLV